MRPKTKTTLLKLSISIGTLVVMMGLIEGWAFLWEKQQATGEFAWELVASRRIDLVDHPEPLPGYTLIKAGSEYEWQSIPVLINSHGLRSPEISIDKPPGVKRILSLGDSIAMGWGVRSEEMYGNLLQLALNEKQDASVEYEVINAGVPGWNLENELAYLSWEGLAYRPDVIVLDLTLVNDIFGQNALDRNNRPPLNEWLRANTYFWPYFSIQMQWVKARSENRERIPVIDPPTRASSYFPTNETAAKWDEFWGQVLAIHAVAEANQIPLVLVMFPLEFQVFDPAFPLTPQQVLNTRAMEAGIPIIDLLPAFAEACAQKPGGACMLEDRYLFADVWMHPSGLGHRLTADEILPVLQAILK